MLFWPASVFAGAAVEVGVLYLGRAFMAACLPVNFRRQPAFIPRIFTGPRCRNMHDAGFSDDGHIPVIFVRLKKNNYGK
ncbi:MAG: hypothetical protein D6714_11225 [Bacteroidetes bacterium]|nr:MAG: hypothetical protein D6714_11225 [Bacteroidota bacterium]